MFIIILFLLGRERCRDFYFHSRFLFFRTHASLLSFFCFFVLFHSCCFNVQVFGKSFVQEFPIPNRHTEGYIIISQNEMNKMVEESPVKN